MRPTRRASFTLFAIVLAVSLLGLAGRPAGAPAAGRAGQASPSGGNGTMYIGGWPDRIYIIDEAVEKVVGQIQLQKGAARTLELSFDRKRFYVLSTTLEDIEVVDIAARKSIDRFTLSEGAQKVRVNGMAVDPLDRFLVLMTLSATKRVDRYEIGQPALIVYDLKGHTVSRRIPWPEGEERSRPRMMLSPDGKYLYIFSDDVLIYETAEFKQVDRWELSRPIEDGLGRLDFGALDMTYEEPGYYTTIVYAQDSVQGRQIMGVARVNLAGKSVDFFPIGPAQRVSFALAPSRKRAFGLLNEIGRYEFWGFDLENRRLINRLEFPGRPRMSLKVSSNGKLLYIWQAGNTIELYDASSYKYLRTMTLDFDNTTQLIMVPADGPASGARPPSSAPGSR